jgi:hypothetical protein
VFVLNVRYIAESKLHYVKNKTIAHIFQPESNLPAVIQTNDLTWSIEQLSQTFNMTCTYARSKLPPHSSPVKIAQALLTIAKSVDVRIG